MLGGQRERVKQKVKMMGGVSLKQARNQEQWKIPGINKGDPG